eukprot:s287_g16.t1
MAEVIEMRVCKFAAEHDKWQTIIDKRAALGRGLTKTQDQSYAVWQTNLVQKIVFNKKRRAFVGEASKVSKDCIAVQLHLSDDPESFLISTGNGSKSKEFRLLLLKKDEQVVPDTVPGVLNIRACSRDIEDAEGEDDVEKDDGERCEELDELSEQQVRELDEQRWHAEDQDNEEEHDDDGFVLLADSDDDDDDVVIPNECSVSKVKSFFRRAAWVNLEKKGLTDLPRHIKGCSIGCHQGPKQWQGFYPNATSIMSCYWGGKTHRREEEALIRVIRGILESHTSHNPKDKVWARQLQKVKEVEATNVF